ncbi:MAG: hypothetical protein ACRDTF_12450 [Pseudonocardiaceae bacterium]
MPSVVVCSPNATVSAEVDLLWADQSEGCLQQPLPTLLDDLVDIQDRVFRLLEGRQRPEQTRDLYLLAGITCGLMADASHDPRLDDSSPHGLRLRGQRRTRRSARLDPGHPIWDRLLSGQWTESAHYAQLDAKAAARSRGTVSVLLASGEARALAALTRLDDAHDALARATDARDRVQPDKLDLLGGICTVFAGQF